MASVISLTVSLVFYLVMLYSIVVLMTKFDDK